MYEAMDKLLQESCVLCGEFSIQMIDDQGLSNVNWEF